jgi:chromosome segregation ATPase
MDKLRSEKTALEEQLTLARDERAKLQRDINLIQQQAESSWSTERMENALLRERINDIAAEVAKLAVTLEGPDSPIEAILASEDHKPAISSIVKATTTNGATPNGAAANGTATEARGTLAERIRALQTHASRARQPG